MKMNLDRWRCSRLGNLKHVADMLSRIPASQKFHLRLTSQCALSHWAKRCFNNVPYDPYDTLPKLFSDVSGIPLENVKQIFGFDGCECLVSIYGSDSPSRLHVAKVLREIAKTGKYKNKHGEIVTIA
jgi:hypothetical protein